MKKWISILFLISTSYLFAQDTTVLRAVDISAPLPALRLSFTLDTVFDKQVLSTGDKLRFLTPINLRSYGPSGITTIQNRGAGNNQIQTLWNGIPIQNEFLGQTDVSLLLLSSAELSFKNFDAQSNSTGGALFADSYKPLRSKLSYKSSFASIQNLYNQIQLDQKFSKSAFKLSFLSNEEQNTFKYLYSLTEPQTQKHAELSQQALLADYWFKPSQNWDAAFHIWVNGSDRKVPPTKFQNYGTARLHDEAYRAQWINTINLSPSIEYGLDGAFDHQTLAYVDTIASINSLAQIDKIYLGQKIHKYWSNVLSSTFMYQNHLSLYKNSEYKTKDYSNCLRQSFALQQELRQNRIFIHQIQARADIYQYDEQFEDNRIRWNGIYVLNVQQSLLNRLQFNAAYNQKEPSLNDLLWFPGGNPNLRPEKGYKLEISLEKRLKNQSFTFNIYHQAIKDKIQWQPAVGFWSPKNLKEVDLSGFEWIWSSDFIKNRPFTYHKQLIVTYNKAIQTATSIQGDNSLGKQLVYVPLWQIKQNNQFSFKNFTLNVGGLFESVRYTSSDNFGYLKAYTILNVSVAYTFNQVKTPIELGLSVQNLSNTNYELVQAYATPLRYYQINFKINIQ